MENKMQDSKREELKKMVNEYQGNCYWEAEGWGDNVPSEEDLEKELESILDYFDSEISKAREEGKREQAELDRALYSVSFEHIKNADFEKILLESVKKAREEGIRYALSEVQERVGMQNEEVYVLCNAILQESLILTTK